MRFKEYKLNDVTINITDGVHNTVTDDENGNCFLLSCKNIKNGRIIIGEKERKINKETLLKLRKRSCLQKEDILITSVGTIGEMSIIEEESPNYDFQRSVAIIKPDTNKVIPKFLYYCLNNELCQINSLIKGAVQKCLFISGIRGIRVILPELELQRKIINVLDNIDKKILINNQINDNLYKSLSFIYKAWFEDFNFYSVDKLIETQIGNIPADFEVLRLEDLISIRGGLAYKASKLSENKLDNVLVSMGNVELNNLFNFNNLKYYSENALDKYVAEVGDIFICTRDVTQQRNQLGCPGIIPKIFKNRNIIIGTNLYIVEHKKFDKSLNRFLFLLLNSCKYRERIVGSAKGTAILMISKDDILKFEFAFPKEKEVLNRFNQIINPIFDKIENNICENENLKGLRDTLLPKLMNGEIDLNKIEI